MTRHLRRRRDFEVTLEISNDHFIRPPRDAQRRWLLSRALDDLVRDLEHLDRVAGTFVAGSEGALIEDRTRGDLEDDELMEDWLIPVMEAMSDIVGGTGGDVLEVGFGRGVASELIQGEGVRSHTIVECNDSVVERFHVWRDKHPDRDIKLIHGKWQDSVGRLEEYDGIFFHTYPLDQEEQLEYVAKSVTFAEHFFPTAASHLRSGGVFTYLTNEVDSLSRAHQRLLFRYFRTIGLETVTQLKLPENSRDDLWGDSMVVIAART